MQTTRLYYDDCYLHQFQASVVEVADAGRRVYLDRTAFYPTSGGQPFDVGTLVAANGQRVRVVEVIDGDQEGIAHVLDQPIEANAVSAEIDWPRRYDHMQQHTGQHLLSAVLLELFQVPTVSFHMGAEMSTIEIAAAGFSPAQTEQVEQRCAELVAAARPVAISYESASQDLGLRKPSQRTGVLRLISMDGIDRSACGGTHVKSTAEIGAIQIRKQEKLRGNVRLEFACGGRALRQAKADFILLQELSRLLSTPAAQTPALVAANLDRAKMLEKSLQELTVELAQMQGRELWLAAPVDANGLKVITQDGIIDDVVRARAQAFVAQGQSVFIAITRDPAAILLAVSRDSGWHAGDRIKAAATAVGGRGGGNAALAQASLPPGVDPQVFARELMA